MKLIVLYYILSGMTIIVATVLVQVCGSKPGKSKAVGLEMLEIVQKGWFEFLFGEFSLFFIMVLTIERWFAVVRPIQYRYKFSKKRIYIYIFTIVIATLSINIHVLLPSYNPYSTRSKSIVVMDFVVTLVTPLLVTWTTYIHLWQRFKKVPTIQQSNNTKMKQRLVRMCAITAMFITACWIPTEIYYLVTTFGLTSEDWRISKSVDTVAMSNSLVNPWIYYFTNKEYKKEFTKLFNDIVFPIQDMVICCPSDSLTVTNVESSDTNSKEIAGTVIPLTNLTLQNE